MINKVLVVVVTFNRLEELKICISSLRQQSVKWFDILVVNNGGHDTTSDWLLQQEDLLCINQENIGGAGGFYVGMDYMMKNKYEWVVLMDDDGVADNTEIEKLVSMYTIVKESYGGDVILNSLVVDIDNHLHTSFIWSRGSNRSNNIEKLKEEDFFEDIHPFNGTLICRSVIEKIGLIKKEMFIWGDEKEYMARAKHYGIGLFTVTSAHHYHPKEKGFKDNLIPLVPFIKILVKPQHLSHYYYRNEGYIYWTYPHKRKKLILFVGMQVFYNLFHLKFSELKKFVVYFYKGVKNIY